MAKPGPDPEVSDSDIIRVIAIDRKPALSSSDIAEEVGISRQALQKHLDRLESEGYLEKGKAGPATIWWPTTKGRQMLHQGSSGNQ